MTGNALADNLAIQPVTIEPGGQGEVDLLLDNPERAYIMTEFYMTLSAGVSIAEDEDGELLYTPNSGRFDRTHQLTVELGENGNYHFLLYSSKNKPLKGNSGALLTMTLQAEANAAAGQYEGKLFGLVFSDENKTEHNPDDATFKVTIGGGTQTLSTTNYDLPKGWHWISTNLADEAQRQSTVFIGDISGKVKRLVSQTEEIIRDPFYGMVGDLELLDVTAAYKIETTADAAMSKQGTAADVTTPVYLYKGWNWIGYLPTEALSVSTALANLSASTGDRLLSQNSFAEYDGTEWQGDFTMLPGHGYMYYRTAAATTFSYSTPVMSRSAMPLGSSNNTSECYMAAVVGNASERCGIVGNASERYNEDGTLGSVPHYNEDGTLGGVPHYDEDGTLGGVPHYWQYNPHLYPDVTTIIARLYIDGQAVELDDYTVGAFCGEECRGIGCVVGDKLFITVHGTIPAAETITFCAAGNTSASSDGSTSGYSAPSPLPIDESIVFQGQCLGSLDSPMPLNAHTIATGISNPAILTGVRAIYAPNGKRLDRAQNGVNIVVLPDGTTRKVVVK